MSKVKFVAGDDIKASWSNLKDKMENKRAERKAGREAKMMTLARSDDTTKKTSENAPARSADKPSQSSPWKDLRNNIDERRAERKARKEERKAARAASDDPAEKTKRKWYQPKADRSAPKTDAPVVHTSTAVQDNGAEGSESNKTEDILRKMEPLKSVLPQNINLHARYEAGFFGGGDKSNEYVEGTVLRGAGMGETYDVRRPVRALGRARHQPRYGQLVA